MKIKNIIITACLLFSICQFTLAQKLQTVQAFKPGKELVTSLKALKLQGIKIAGDGTTSPDRGYKMVYSKSESKFYILPLQRKVAELKAASGGKDLGGGVYLRCIGCSDCKVTESDASGGGKVYSCSQDKCQGTASGCNGSVIVEKKEVASYLGDVDWTRF